MADSTSTLTPNGDVSKVDWVRTGGASDNAALSDSSDATYLSVTNTAANMLRVALSTHTFAATDQIKSLTVSIRAATLSGQPVLGVALYDGSTGMLLPVTSDGLGVQIASPTTYTISYTITGTITQTMIDNLQLGIFKVYDAFATSVRVYEASLIVGYNQPPTVSAVTVTPSGTVTTTDRPTVSWTFSDPEFDGEDRYQVKIFSAAQYGAGGFGPETSTATYASGEKIGTAFPTPYVLPTSLPNNTTYKAYVKASDAGSGARYSAWASSAAFTISVVPPATPTIVALADNVLDRIRLTIQGLDNMLTLNQSGLETDTTGWTSEINCSIARSTAQFAEGAASLRLNATTAATMTARAAPNTVGSSATPVSPSTQYTALASFRAAVSARSCNVQIKWFKADGSAASTVSNTGSNVTDSTGAFTQAFVTATAPADAAFVAVCVNVLSAGAINEQHYVDKISLTPGSSTTWSPGGYDSTQLIGIERSADNGATWAPVDRVNMTSPATDVDGFVNVPDTTEAGVGYDYETVRGVVYSYRAYSSALGSTGSYLSSPYSAITSASVSLENCGWNIKVPEDPTLNIIGIQLEFDAPAMLQRTRPEQAGFFAAIGRNKKIKVSDVVLGDEFTLEALCETQAQRDAITNLVNSQLTALVQEPAGRQWYVGFDTEVTFEDLTWSTPYFYSGVTFRCIEVDAP